MMVQARVERWASDEFPLPAKLVYELLQWLYRENRFCAGTFRIADRVLGPAALRVPALGSGKKANIPSAAKKKAS